MPPGGSCPGSSRRRFLLLYGSQTGQARAIAEEVAEKAIQYGLLADIHCLSMTEKQFWLERETLAVIITSTTGDGEAPDTAQKFWRRLKKRTLPETHLQHLRYALLGLGDSNYTNFCRCGRMFDHRLEELGAKRFLPSAWADDAVGLEVAVEPWIDDLWSALRQELGLPPTESGLLVNGTDLDPTGSYDGPCNKASLPNGNVPSLTLSQQSLAGKIGEKGDSVTTGDLIAPSITESKSAEASPLSSADQSAMSKEDLVALSIMEVKLAEESPSSSVTQEDLGAVKIMEVKSAEKSPSSCAEPSAVQSKTVKAVGDLNQDLEKTRLCCEQETESLTCSVPPLSESSLTLPICPVSFLDIEFHPDEELDVQSLPVQNGCAFPSACSPVYHAPVVDCTKLTADGAVKTTLSIDLDMSGCDWRPEPGDSFSVVCSNGSIEVNDLLNRLNVADKADTVCTLQVKPGTTKRNATVPEHYPTRCTLRHLLHTCCDIWTVPKKALLRVLVEHTQDPRQKRRLQELCSKQGSSQYAKYVREKSVSLPDILAAFPSCQPPVTCVIEHLPRLQPRPYSAASSPLVTKDRLRFVFNIVEIPGGQGRVKDRRGVCTGWLSSLTHVTGPEDLLHSAQAFKETLSVVKGGKKIRIPIFLRSNQHFHQPSDLATPLVMIGPGTGVAPFLGFLQHREEQQSNASPGTKIGPTWLFFGCRHHQKDFIFQQELKHFADVGTLSKLLVSFSRDVEQRPDGPKYVQDNMRLYGQDLVRLIADQRAFVFVCGDAKNMARGVQETFVEILQEHKGLEKKDAEAYMMTMKLHRRYLEDVWL